MRFKVTLKNMQVLGKVYLNYKNNKISKYSMTICIIFIVTIHFIFYRSDYPQYYREEIELDFNMCISS